MTATATTASRSMTGASLPFALPIGLSAFLLFSVEPLVGRLVLPVFGGTPAVWATVLFFFQVVLLAGYAYGHLSVTRFGRWGPLIHLVLAGIAFVMLLRATGNVADVRNEAVTPVVDLISILIGLIGLPAFVLTTTTPILSGWFNAARDGDHDPYWLYALSNAGSLLALLAYPLLIEPRLGLGTQRLVWAVVYAVLIVLIAVAALRAMPGIVARPRGYFRRDELIGGRPKVSPVVAITWPRRARWLLLAAVPSGLLSAVTNFIATDLVSAPLLWVMPLAIYLISFIIAFSPQAGWLIRGALIAAPAAVTLLWVPYGSAGGWPVLILVLAELLAFAVVALALHGRLAHDRPDPAHLTEFYLTISTGGALAAGFVALVAPSVFPDIWEYPMLLVGALVALALLSGQAPGLPRSSGGFNFGPFLAGLAGRFVPYVIGAVALGAALFLTGAHATEAGIRWLIVGGLILLFGGRAWFLVVATAVVLTVATLFLKPAAEFRGRSFFGVTEVLRPADGALTFLMNGTTVHGTQFTDPARRGTPTTYFEPTGPAADIFAVGADSSPAHPRSVAVVGLGAGTLAAYKDSWMTMTYFEIDPIVIRVAGDERYFTYLADAPGRPDIVEGDARLSLADQPDARYDLLILDAFSSDAVPTHLLTVEAVAEELRTLKPDGVIAFQISNRYYDLEPPIAAALYGAGLNVLEGVGDGRGPGGIPSRWLAASRSSEHVSAFRALGWTEATPAERPFTDDYADLLSYLNLVP